MNRVILGVVVALASALPLASPFAAERVVMSGGNFGENFAFIDRYLRIRWQDSYGVEPEEGTELLTLDEVFVGRHDINNDLQDELFVHMEVSCGSVGCPTAVFEKRDGEWEKLFSNISVLGHERVDGELVYFLDVWNDPDTGHRSVFSYFAGFRWTGERYEYLGDNEVVEVSAQMPPDFDAEGRCIEPREGGFKYLLEYVGTRKRMCLIHDPNVKPGLDALLGAEFLHLRKNLDRRASVDFSEGYVAIEGSRRPTDRDWDESAMVMVSTHDGQAHVGIYSEGTRTIYSRAQQWSHLPSLFRAWARGSLDPYDFEAPPDIVWIGRAEDKQE